MRKGIEIPSFRFIYNRKNKELKPMDTVLIQVMVYYQRERKYFSTGIYVTQDCWNDKDSKIIKRIDAVTLNRHLFEFKQKFENYYFQNPSEFSFYGLEEFIKQEKKQDDKASMESFIDWAYFYISKMNIKDKSKQTYTNSVNLLHEFGKLERFCDFNCANISDFHLHVSKGREKITISKIIKHIRSFVKEDISLGLIKEDPFIKLKIVKGGSKKRKFLSLKDFQKLKNTKFENKRLQCVKDSFLFCCYTGLAYQEAFNLTYDHIVDVDGKR